MKLAAILSVTVLVCAAACSAQTGSEPEGATGAAQAQESAPSAKPVLTGVQSSVPTRGFAESRQAVVGAMPTLRALVASGQPTTRGFRSLAEVDSTVVADPLPVYMIGHTSVTGWSAGQDPHALLIDRQERLLPLVVSGEVRSSATTKERSPGVWEVAEFDYGPLAKAAADARSALARSRGVDPASVTLVEIPTLSAHLLGDEENGALMLTPIFDVPGTSLVAGQTVPASVALPALQPLALTVNLNAPD